jgi:hypothetical protein
MAESDWFISEKYIKIINIILIISFLICFASYSLTIPKAKFSEARLLFIIVFRALVYILLLFFYNNINTFY